MPWLESLFGFRGRLGRLRFFGMSCLNAITFGLLMIVGLAMIHLHSLVIGGVLALIGFILLTWVSLALQWKRLHDLGYSGWYAIAIVVFSNIVQIIARTHHLVGLLLGLIDLAIAILLLFIRGTNGPNGYGPAPNVLV